MYFTINTCLQIHFVFKLPVSALIYQLQGNQPETLSHVLPEVLMYVLNMLLIQILYYVLFFLNLIRKINNFIFSPKYSLKVYRQSHLPMKGWSHPHTEIQIILWIISERWQWPFSENITCLVEFKVLLVCWRKDHAFYSGTVPLMSQIIE